jgi:transcriptional regulator with XRE-family HTH domain
MTNIEAANPQTFGQTVRSLRQAKSIGLRELARRVGISPTYLTQIEKDACPVPEERVVAFARALDQDSDEFLALAGRVASDVDEIIRFRPRATATFLRVARQLSEEDWKKLTDQIQGKQGQ